MLIKHNNTCKSLGANTQQVPINVSYFYKELCILNIQSSVRNCRGRKANGPHPHRVSSLRNGKYFHSMILHIWQEFNGYLLDK